MLAPAALTFRRRDVAVQARSACTATSLLLCAAKSRDSGPRAGESIENQTQSKTVIDQGSERRAMRNQRRERRAGIFTLAREIAVREAHGAVEQSIATRGSMPGDTRLPYKGATYEVPSEEELD